MEKIQDLIDNYQKIQDEITKQLDTLSDNNQYDARYMLEQIHRGSVYTSTNIDGGSCFLNRADVITILCEKNEQKDENDNENDNDDEDEDSYDDKVDENYIIPHPIFESLCNNIIFIDNSYNLNRKSYYDFSADFSIKGCKINISCDHHTEFDIYINNKNIIEGMLRCDLYDKIVENLYKMNKNITNKYLGKFQLSSLAQLANFLENLTCVVYDFAQKM